MIAFPLGVLLHKVKPVSTRRACQTDVQAVMPKSTGMLCKYLFAKFDFISVVCVHQVLFFDIMLCLCFTQRHSWLFAISMNSSQYR